MATPERSPKRRKLSTVEEAEPQVESKKRLLRSLEREISPPPPKSRNSTPATTSDATPGPSTGSQRLQGSKNATDVFSTTTVASSDVKSNAIRVVSSPFRLSRIEDLPEDLNRDSVGIRDLLGDPLIKEVWLFDYLFDLDFIRRSFDPDVKDLVRVKIVHGSWKQDSEQKIYFQKESKNFPNFELITAYMPEPFGTHHTKMMVIFRHDDSAQVIVHTANMIPKDWGNMTQGIWISPMLPLLPSQPYEEDAVSENKLNPELDQTSAPYESTIRLTQSSKSAISRVTDQNSTQRHPIGSGNRFKADLLRYIFAYERRTRSLAAQLKDFDFSAIRAAFLASVPSRESLLRSDPARFTSWGWPGMQQILKSIPLAPTSSSNDKDKDIIAVQISSIATIPEKWSSSFFDVLRSQKQHTSTAWGSLGLKSSSKKAIIKIIFPTVDEIRNSLYGYFSGGSIHMKTQSASQKRQLMLLRPMFCHWSGPGNDKPSSTATKASSSDSNKTSIGSALRGRAAPHIKTYTRFDSRTSKISWSLLTSANLSVQAWGSLPDADQKVRICSWEAGVVVWPDLFASIEGGAEMCPVFGRDTFRDFQPSGPCEMDTNSTLRVPLRIPYDLPIKEYDDSDVPWCTDERHTKPDLMGRSW